LLIDYHITIGVWSKSVSEPSKQCIPFWLINNLTIDNLREYLEHAELLINPNSTLFEPVNQYCVTLSSFLDKHGPKQTQNIQVRPPAPWMSLEILHVPIRSVPLY